MTDTWTGQTADRDTLKTQRAEADKYVDTLVEQFPSALPGDLDANIVKQRVKASLASITSDLAARYGIPENEAVRFLGKELVSDGRFRESIVKGQGNQERQAAEAELAEAAVAYFKPELAQPKQAAQKGPLTNQDMAQARQLLANSGLPPEIYEQIDMMFKRGEVPDAVDAISKSKYYQDPAVRQALEILAR